MKTAEDYLKLVQQAADNFGYKLKFLITRIIQPGTFAFECKTATTWEEKDSIRTHFRYMTNLFGEWLGNRFVIYPEINIRHVNILNEIILNKRNKNFVGFLAREEKNLRKSQIIFGFRFSNPVSQFVLESVAQKFQLETGLFAKWVSGSKLFIDSAVTVDRDKILKQQTERQQEAKQKKLYAKECGKLSDVYEVPFINVLCIGPDEEKIKKHAVSLQRAAGLIAAQEREEKTELYYGIFVCQKKETKEKALKSLGIYFDKADVRRMDFSILEKSF